MRFPSLTQEWHTESYRSIDPSRPELSAAGKVVAITGGGGSIGGAIAIAFAKAGAKGIAIIVRRNQPLQEVKGQILQAVPGATVQAISGDISDAQSMKRALDQVKKDIGAIDIMIANAGHFSGFTLLQQADEQEWWRAFETNVKGAFNTTRAFASVAVENATLVNISTGIAHMPAMPQASSHAASKLAATKIYEVFGKEHAGISVFHVQPGSIDLETHRKAGVPADDQADLPGSFVVWLVSPEGSFLRGKYLWVSWDVDELKSRREELEKPGKLMISLEGWPFGRSGAAADALKEYLDK